MPHFLRSGVNVIEITTNPTVSVSKTKKYMFLSYMHAAGAGDPDKTAVPHTPPPGSLFDKQN